MTLKALHVYILIHIFDKINFVTMILSFTLGSSMVEHVLKICEEDNNFDNVFL